ncbi:hypothetical protein ACH5RR_035058 [Cinchona calisaya]|uniref:Serpin domain-containing protein n=1 Tax=Cinchona calisaya TaxID=153742 RepID=A0ABD2YH60_9GENT
MDFCARMTGRLLLNQIKKASAKNVVVSPLSFNAVLNMVAAGSTGHTLREMSKFLEYKNIDDTNSKFKELMSIASSSSTDDHGNNVNSGPVICLANGLWVDKKFPLKASYQELVKNVNKAQVKNMDFEKVNEVVEDANAWAKSATKGLVTDVLKPENVTPLTKLILGNALYFKGCWKEKFNSSRTKNQDFYLLNGYKVSVPFMTGCGKYSHGSFDGFELVKIPYLSGNDGKSYSMFIFLPNERDGLQKLLEKATCDPGFFRQDFHLQNWKYDIFWIPKFKFTYGTSEAREIMIDMGLKLPFMPDCEELTGLIDTKGETFSISAIIQKAFIEVDEVGTEAAAVTFTGLAGCGHRPKTTRFVADHPFMFMIREEWSRSVLFTGAILNPSLG